MKKHRTPKSICLHCGAELDATTDVSDRNHTPTEGSFSVCAYCYAVCVFNRDLTLRPLFPWEVGQFQKAIAEIQLDFRRN
jgi:hypothetical protein